MREITKARWEIVKHIWELIVLLIEIALLITSLIMMFAYEFASNEFIVALLIFVLMTRPKGDK